MAIPKALTIAGSDSGAGAGVQADLKTFAALGVYGTSVLTAVTAQNTEGVTGILTIPPRLVTAQIEAVMDDIGASAAKTGMLANAAIIRAVATKISDLGMRNLVVDPVMVAKGGDVLLRQDAIQTLRSRLLPLATLVTPNVPEAQELTGIEGSSVGRLKDMAKAIIGMGAENVVIKGGHRRGPATDIFYDGRTFTEYRCQRIRTRNTHGTGCTYSAAIAAFLARGETLERAVSQAKDYITRAISAAFSIGSGHSPVHHFHRYWRDELNS